MLKPDGKTGGQWTTLEHAKFVEALKIYGKDYQSIADIVGTRDSNQVKSHAQKFMQQLKKSTKSEDRKLFETLNVNLRVLT